MRSRTDDPHFTSFKLSLEQAIKLIEKRDSDVFLVRQRRYFNTLVRLEREFRVFLASTKQGQEVYRSFVKYICDRQGGKRGGILDARPYFRVRQGRFSSEVSKAFRDRDWEQLARFPINYRFVSYAMESTAWRPGSKAVKLADQIRSVRDKIVTMNLPLVISQARIFWSKNSRGHLSYMDFVQIATEGLMSGIDKFCPPFNAVFMGVAVGRMRGNLIESNSETPIHFFPDDKRRLYRIRKAAGRGDNVSIEDITRAVNDGVKDNELATEDQVANLMAAAATVSLDARRLVTDDGQREPHSARYAAPTSCQPDSMVEAAESEKALHEAYGVLSLYEKKILRAFGVDVGE